MVSGIFICWLNWHFSSYRSCNFCFPLWRFQDLPFVASRFYQGTFEFIEKPSCFFWKLREWVSVWHYRLAVIFDDASSLITMAVYFVVWRFCRRFSCCTHVFLFLISAIGRSVSRKLYFDIEIWVGFIMDFHLTADIILQNVLHLHFFCRLEVITLMRILQLEVRNPKTRFRFIHGKMQHSGSSPI